MMDHYITLIWETLINYGPQVIGAILVLVVGLWVIKLMTKSMRKLMLKSNLDISLVPFLSSIADIVLKVLLVISVMSMVGIAMTSFIAILGAAGLALGMALSGTLQNFAGGVIILILKPYKVGDFIEALGYTGTVKEILIFNTFLLTEDNRKVIIPNGALSNSSLINYSAMKTRRVDFVFGVGYSDDMEKVRKIIKDEIAKLSYVLQQPVPFVMVGNLGESSVDFTIRVWVKFEDYVICHFELTENIKKAFDANNINIPFPQRDIHVFH